MIRIALGTVHVLGLKKIKIVKKSLPTTAHFMTVGQCVYDCGFCSQAKSSRRGHQYLSRITWPIFNEEKIKKRLQKRLNRKFKRICLQVVQSPDYLKQTSAFIDYIKKLSALPLSISIRPKNLKELKMLFKKGVDRVSLAIDAVNENDYQKIKKGDYKKFLDFLIQACQEFPAKITTHLIVGFSETEKEIVELMKKLNNHKITIGLFAFTPIFGTRLEKAKPPSIRKYRRIQLAHFLITQRLKAPFRFDGKGRLTSFGHSKKELLTRLRQTTVFQTTGCPFCNRPYYNEKPSGLLYNYPYRLSEREFKKAINELKTPRR